MYLLKNDKRLIVINPTDGTRYGGMGCQDPAQSVADVSHKVGAAAK